MPELPEVETIVRELRRAGVVGRRILRATVRWNGIIAEPKAPAFRRNIRGRRIEGLARRGKFIVMQLSDGLTLLIHLRMTGRLEWSGGKQKADPHEHVVLTLDDGRVLGYHDTRKFGRWFLLRDASMRLGCLGPEPLGREFTLGRLSRLLSARARMLKPLLLDQRCVAGLGNIYVDEALWEAGLHPRQSSNSLTLADRKRLHRSIRQVLSRGISRKGTSLGKGEANFHGTAGRRGRNQDGLRVFHRTGRPCPRCGRPIVRLVVAQRSTHVCPECQKERSPKRSLVVSASLLL